MRTTCNVLVGKMREHRAVLYTANGCVMAFANQQGLYACVSVINIFYGRGPSQAIYRVMMHMVDTPCSIFPRAEWCSSLDGLCMQIFRKQFQTNHNRTLYCSSCIWIMFALCMFVHVHMYMYIPCRPSLRCSCCHYAHRERTTVVMGGGQRCM